MEKIVLDSAIKFGAGRYRQGAGILAEAGEEIKRFSKKAFFVSGPRAWAAVEDVLVKSMNDAGVPFEHEVYEGWCSYESAKEYADKCIALGCDEVIGVGGGKIMDFSKAVAEYAGVGVINIPTSMSTCAPFTCMSVMYTPAGGKKDCWRYSHELDGLLVDTKVIAECPIRYNAAGILDAMAKKIEIQNGKPVMTLEDNTIALFTAFNMAQYTYDVLEKWGPQAIEDNRNNKVTKVLEDVIYIAIAITGVIANITQSFSQSAIAHSIYDGVRTHFTKEAALALHGEIVAVGLFAQLHYNKLDKDMEALKEYMRGMDMPLTWEALGIPATKENLQIIEDYLIDSPYVAPGEESLELLHEAVYKMV